MFAGISIWQLLILLLVVVVIFGTKKLRTIGSDLGGAVKDFKKAMNESEAQDAQFNKIEEPTSTANMEKTKEKEQA